MVRCHCPNFIFRGKKDGGFEEDNLTILFYRFVGHGQPRGAACIYIEGLDPNEGDSQGGGAAYICIEGLDPNTGDSQGGGCMHLHSWVRPK
eukprot:1158090-Pelagomonas_calceolata.AAC.1